MYLKSTYNNENILFGADIYNGTADSSKKENSFAVQKWCEDLDFVHAYRMETQPQTYISRVTKYWCVADIT